MGPICGALWPLTVADPVPTLDCPLPDAAGLDQRVTIGDSRLCRIAIETRRRKQMQTAWPDVMGQVNFMLPTQARSK